jgi:hypothetical protein
VQVVDDGKEEKKLAMARAILAGNTSFINDNADVFEGLSPTEIEEYVAKATQGATSSDPFEVVITVHCCVSWCSMCWPVAPAMHAAHHLLHTAWHSLIRLELMRRQSGCVCVQGMSPEEINAYIEKHGEPAAA